MISDNEIIDDAEQLWKSIEFGDIEEVKRLLTGNASLINFEVKWNELVKLLRIHFMF